MNSSCSPCYDAFRVNDTITCKCENGTQHISGDILRQCMDSNVWSGDQLICAGNNPLQSLTYNQRHNHDHCLTIQLWGVVIVKLSLIQNIIYYLIMLWLVKYWFTIVQFLSKIRKNTASNEVLRIWFSENTVKILLSSRVLCYLTGFLTDFYENLNRKFHFALLFPYFSAGIVQFRTSI